MRETIELRLSEDKARLYLKPDEGKVGSTGSARKLLLDANDIRVARIGKIHQEIWKQGSIFVTGWEVRRKYTKKELEAAELFQLKVCATFEPDGSQCGTEYDDTTGCPHCGVGARQCNELKLDPSTLPRGKDLAKTIAYNEVIVSARLVEALQEHGIMGARFLPVLRKGGRGVIDSWYQLEVTSRPIAVAPRTRFGINLFDPDEAGEYRCPYGHVLGLNILSELSVQHADWDGADVCATKQWVGYRSRDGGVFRPHPLLLISQRLRRLLGNLSAKGFELEVAHLVRETG